jgi:hypothetical protein
MREMRSAYKIVTGKPEVKRSLRIDRCIWGDNIGSWKDKAESFRLD